MSTSGCDEGLLYKLRSYSLSPFLAPVESTSMSWAGPYVRQHVYRGGCELGKVRMGHPPPCVVRSFCGVVLRICVVVPAAFVGRCLARVARCNVLAAAASHCLRPCLSGGPRLAVWVVVGRQSPWACRMCMENGAAYIAPGSEEVGSMSIYDATCTLSCGGLWTGGTRGMGWAASHCGP